MLSAAESQVWDALEIGPQWILRETEDVTLPETGMIRRETAPVRPVVPATSDTGFVHLTSASEMPAVRPAAPSARPAVRPAPSVSPVSEPVRLAHPLVEMPADLSRSVASADWSTLEALSRTCNCCSMAKSRQHVVFAEGGPGMRIALVGEAPGSEEDLQGIPFVGKSGQLLTHMLESIGIERNRDIAIMNVLKCRPPGNRNPAPDEVMCCAAFLRRQLELVRPDVILVMGRFAVQSLLQTGSDVSIGSCRGRVHDIVYGGIHARGVVTYHPSYLLRSPDAKAKAWEDLVLFKQTIAEAGITLAKTERRD